MAHQQSAARSLDCPPVDLTPAVLPLPEFEPPLEPEPPARAAPRLIDRAGSAGRAPVATVLEFPAARFPEPPPDPNQWARAIILATLEALHGARSPLQLRRWFSPPVHAAVTARAACAPRSGKPPRIYVRSVRTTVVGEGRVEAAGVVEVAGRCRAVALQMRMYDGRWRVTALEIG